MFSRCSRAWQSLLGRIASVFAHSRTAALPAAGQRLGISTFTPPYGPAGGGLTGTYPSNVHIRPTFVTSLSALAPVGSRQRITVDGYSASGDGGGGEYDWNATDTRAADGGTIVAVTGIATGRWNRVYSGPLDVHWFGAKGDATADGGGTDDTAAFVAALTSSQMARGGTLRAHSKAYLIQANALQFVSSGTRLFGDAGTFDFQVDAALQTQGTRFILAGAGKAIRGPSFGATTAASNVSCCAIADIAIYWATTVRGTPGCIGIDESGFNRSHFQNLNVVTPKGSADSYCYYATTTTVGGVAQACYYNLHVNCSGFSDENSASGHVISGTKGIYYQFNPAAGYTHDGGGVNANKWVGGTMSACETAIHWGRQDGCVYYGATIEGYWKHAVIFGASDGSSGAGIGSKVYIDYAETTPGNSVSFLVQFGTVSNVGEQVNFNEVHAGLAILSIRAPGDVTQGTLSSCTIPGLIDPVSFLGNNSVTYNNARHGRDTYFPFPTITPGNHQGVFSGRPAVRCMPIWATSGATLAQLEANLNLLLYHMMDSGTMEPYHPRQEGQVVSVWHRADYGNPRYPNAVSSDWFDAIQNQRATMHGQPVYQVGTYTGPDSSVPLQNPYFALDGASYWTETLPATITNFSLAMLVCTKLQGTMQGFVELTPAGVTGTGVSVQNTASNVVVSLLGTNNAVAPQADIADNWHVIGLTVTSTHVKIFIDGVLIQDTAGSYSLPTLADISIGALSNGTQPMTGGVREVIVWATDISDASHANVHKYFVQENALVS